MMRRDLLKGLLGALGLALGRRAGAADEAPGVERFELPKSQWKERLPPSAYAVLFEEDTEPPRSSPLDREKRAGTYVCAACMLPLFESKAKFDSGTGWPSFFQSLEGHVATRTDSKQILPARAYALAR